MNVKPIRRIALVGFGEAGGIFGQDFAAAGFDVAITDILLRREASRGLMLEKARRAKVEAFDSLEDAVRDSNLVLSAVTSSAAADVAAEASTALRAGQIFLDINSVSPEKKIEIGSVISGSNAIFVEAAVMAPVPPQRLKVPMLLGGPAAQDIAGKLQAIGMNATVASDRIGVASAIKMCRSIVIKGLEALTVESLFAARRYGAENEVLASLAETYPDMGWHSALPDYLVSRVAQHGRRRASEMREVAATLQGVNIDPWMALATAQRQDWLVQEMDAQSVAYPSEGTFSWKDLAEALGSNQNSAAGHTTHSADDS